MSDQYYKIEHSLKDTLCAINNCQPADLEVAGFFDTREACVVSFAQKLLSLKDKRFLVVGDYDCDGVMATTIVKRLLEKLNIEHNYYIPSRIKDGYGLNKTIVEMAINNHFEALLLVDNGVVASEALTLAKKAGLAVLIIDHHEFKQEPLCDALIHPSFLNAPYCDLCAGGLTYLLSTLFYQDELSLVYAGLATLADMVSVLGYNRYLLKEMLRIINSRNIYQVLLLFESKPYHIDYEDLSFSIIPKINAISRMEPSANVNMLVRYLLADQTTCSKVAVQINQINRERKTLSDEYLKRAMAQIDISKPVLVYCQPDLKEGLLGILANRLMHKFNKPAIVFCETSSGYKGSGRSVEGSDLFTYLSQFSDYYQAFGGHLMAVGLTVKAECFSAFLKALNEQEFVYETKKALIRLEQDGLCEELVNQLEQLKPFGQGFKEPLFIFKPLITERRLLAKRYPKFLLSDGNYALSFNEDHCAYQDQALIGRLKRDNFKRSILAFMIEDLL